MANIGILVLNFIILYKNSNLKRIEQTKTIMVGNSMVTTHDISTDLSESFQKKMEMMDARLEKMNSLLAKYEAEEIKAAVKAKENEGPIPREKFLKLPETEQYLIIQKELGNPNGPNAKNRKYIDFLESRKEALHMR